MDNNTTCPVQNCLGKWLGTAVITFILLFAMGYLIHHVWLMPIYQATASLWRPMDEMQNMMPQMLLYYALLSLAISALFCKAKKARMAECANLPEADCKIGGKKCPIKCGACFGIAIGVLMGAMAAGNYIWLPIPSQLAVKWFIANVVQGIVIGVVLSLCCCKKKA